MSDANEPEARPDSVDKGGPAERGFDGLSTREGRAVEALLSGQTIPRAAIAAGISARTLRRWLRKDAFRAVLLDARRESFQQAVGLTSRYAPAAVGALVKVLNDMLAPPSARVTAAAVLLKFGREGIELDDLGERVAQLEALLASASPALPAPEEADEQ